MAGDAQDVPQPRLWGHFGHCRDFCVVSQLFSGGFPRRGSLLAQPQLTENGFWLRGSALGAVGSPGSPQGGGHAELLAPHCCPKLGSRRALWGTPVAVPQLTWLLKPPLPAQHLPEEPCSQHSSLQGPSAAPLSSEVGASSPTPLPETPRAGQNSPKFQPNQLKEQSIPEQEGSEGWGGSASSQLTAHSSGATKHPGSSNHNPHCTLEKNWDKREPK